MKGVFNIRLFVPCVGWTHKWALAQLPLKKRRGVHDIEKEKQREWERKMGFV